MPIVYKGEINRVDDLMVMLNTTPSRFDAAPLPGDNEANGGIVEGLMLRKEYDDGSFKRMKLVRGEFKQAIED